MKALCLFNPRSGKGAAAAEAARQAMPACGLEPTMVALGEADAAALLGERARAFDRLIVCGGDGTLHSLLPALLALGRPVGLIPAGTANDFARSLGLPDDPEAACRIIARGGTRAVDVGYLGSRPFLNAVQIGLAAGVARLHDGWAKQTLGVFGYPLSWFKAWREHRPFRAELEIDGAPGRVRAQQITVGSGRSYGGGMLLSEDAAPDDGFLRLVHVEPVRARDWVRLFWRLRQGKPAPEAVRRTAWRVAVKARPPQPMSVDGEPAGTTPAVVTVWARRLHVYAPPPAPPAAPADAVTKENRP